MIVHEVPQGTQRWLDLRKGIPTASCFDRIVTSGGKKGIPGASSQAEAYMNHLLAERILGHPIDGFKSQWMEHGNEFEDRAIAAYELENDCDTEKIGFVTTDDGRIGCSPDRLIVGNDRGQVEAKAPAPATHVAYLLAATGAEIEYKIQLQGQLWVCERDWVDIISYHPGMPVATFRVNRDEPFITELAARVRAFSCQLEEKAELLSERGWIKAKTEAAPENFGTLGITDDDIRWMIPGIHYPMPSLSGFPDEDQIQ